MKPCWNCGGTEWVRCEDGTACGNCGMLPEPCRYSAACRNAATTVIEAPAIRDRFPDGVPACESCAAFVERIK